MRETLAGGVGDGSVPVTDAHWAHAGVEEAPGVDAEHLAHRSGEAASAALSGVNAPHARLEDFLGGMNGVSARRLPLYLAWFCWLERARGAGGGAREAARDPCLSGRYRTTRRALFAATRYDMGYWERRRAAA